jgi:hypothetical protein
LASAKNGRAIVASPPLLTRDASVCKAIYSVNNKCVAEPNL